MSGQKTILPRPGRQEREGSLIRRAPRFATSGKELVKDFTHEFFQHRAKTGILRLANDGVPPECVANPKCVRVTNREPAPVGVFRLSIAGREGLPPSGSQGLESDSSSQSRRQSPSMLFCPYTQNTPLCLLAWWVVPSDVGPARDVGKTLSPETWSLGSCRST